MVAIGRSGVWSRSPRAGKHNADNNDDIFTEYFLYPDFENRYVAKHLLSTL